jgi:uncharacterized damage-inducible protein DinB
MSSEGGREALMHRVEELHREVTDLAAGLTPEQLDWEPGENAWTVRQVLAHLGEFPGYFIGELERVLRDPAGRWGRGVDHAVRLETVAAGRTADLGALRQRIDAAYGRVLDVLERVSDADLATEAEHVSPRFGRRSMGWLVEHFIVEHTEGHIGQIRRNLGQLEESRRG